MPWVILLVLGEQILLYYLKVFKNLILVLFIIFSFFIIYVLNKNIELNKNQFEVYKGSTITEVIENIVYGEMISQDIEKEKFNTRAKVAK